MHRRNIVVFRTLNIQGVRHTDGVGFMQSLTVPIKKSKIKLNIIQCYVPTNDADDKKKDAFYLLHIVLNKAGKNDMTILKATSMQRWATSMSQKIRSTIFSSTGCQDDERSRHFIRPPSSEHANKDLPPKV